jgi:Ca2+/Na+ antiporter
MRVSSLELGIVVLLIGYVAFYTHPAPSHIKDFLSSPVGTVVALLSILGVAVYKSLVVGVFLAIAFVMTVHSVTEYLDEKEQKPAPEKAQPSNKAPAPEMTGALMKMLGKKPEPHKGDRLEQHHQKKGTHSGQKVPAVTPPKPNTPNLKTMETFASF